MNDLHNSSKLFPFILFADDTTLLTKKGINKNFINRELCKISIWFKVNKLSLNVPKSKCILFHQPQKKIIELEIIIDGNKIDCVNNFNFLGLIINKHLNWNNHIDHISLKISRVIGILTRLRHTVPIDVLLLLYNSLVLPHINYSLLVWGHNPFRITKLQKKCLRIITSSKIFAHCDPIFKNLRLLKTEDIFKIKQLKFYYKYAKQSLLFSIPETINNCALNIKEKLTTHSIEGMSMYAKNFLLTFYNLECNIPDCYVCVQDV